MKPYAIKESILILKTKLVKSWRLIKAKKFLSPSKTYAKRNKEEVREKKLRLYSLNRIKGKILKDNRAKKIL